MHLIDYEGRIYFMYGFYSCSTTGVTRESLHDLEFFDETLITGWITGGNFELNKTRQNCVDSAWCAWIFNWVRKFKLALHLRTRANSIDDYQRSLRIMTNLYGSNSVSGDENVEWYRLHMN